MIALFVLALTIHDLSVPFESASIEKLTCGYKLNLHNCCIFNRNSQKFVTSWQDTDNERFVPFTTHCSEEFKKDLISEEDSKLIRVPSLINS